MRVGLALGVSGLPLAAMGALAARAEAAGFDTLCAGEAVYESFACCSAIATATSRARVYSGITTWARSPVLTAIGAATLAELSGGRFTLGLGTMPAAWNRDFHGIDPARPLARMREYVEVVRRALAGEADFKGEFYSVSGYRRPPATVAIQLAATRPAMARLAGEIADGVLYNFIHTRAHLRDVMGPALAAAGRSPERGVMVRAHVDSNPAAARAAITRSLEPYRKVDYLREVVGDGEPDAIYGPPAECRAQLAEYEGLVDWVELAPPSGLAEPELAQAYDRLIETFGR